MKENKILFFSDTYSNRLKYIVELIFQDLLKISIIFTQNKEEYMNSPLPKINYSQSPFYNDEVFIKNQTLLFENQIFFDQIFLKTDFSFISQKKQHSILSFDFFALAFFFVSRYEEYIADPSVLDGHCRFSASESIAQKYGFLHQPIINYWALQIRDVLQKKFPFVFIETPQYRFQPTFDIDMAWKYKHKGFTRSGGALIRDMVKGNFEDLKTRINILFRNYDDPDFVFDYIFELHASNNLKPIFFWLLGDHAKFDKNIHWKNNEFRNLIKLISNQYTIGLHPSYRSNSSLNILKKEKNRLDTILGNPTPLTDSISRQHYLKLRFPETYRRLLMAGLNHDYSLGYADDIGFRASIASPFRWFDLEKNEVTHLWVHPFQVMDVTLRDYLKLSPDQAIEYVTPLIEKTKSVGGTFTTLWHNSSFSNTEGWTDWRVVYEKIIETAR